jgi:hypothetical protein
MQAEAEVGRSREDFGGNVEQAVRELGAQFPVPFFCECHDPGCRETVRLSWREYTAIHSHPRRAVVVAGHENEWLGDEIVEESPAYVVVQKQVEPA